MDPNILIAWRNAALLDHASAGVVRVLYIGDRHTSGLAGAAPACDLAFVGSRAAHDLYRPLLDPRHGYIVHSCGHDVAPGAGDGVVRRRRQCVHASAPERGLAPLLQLWPRIRERVPDAELVVMGGYRLWGYSPTQAHALARHHVPALEALPDGVTHLGEVDRSTYLRTLAGSQLMLYPTDYEEMCCITALEASALGTIPVVSDRAALRERTADGSAGVLIPGPASHPATQARFVEETVRLLQVQDETRLSALRDAALAHASAHTTAEVIGNLLTRVRACL
jgi:glycosyltransferase involved in cell wall biosynthesis